MQSLAIGACVAFCFFLAGCATADLQKPDPMRQPWRESWDALADAKEIQPEALRRSFGAARSQVTMPRVNAGEDAEAIAENLQAILEAVGDRAFAEALLREEPATRTAVRDCMFESAVKGSFPMTHQVLREAPPIEWPSDRAYQQSWAESGKPAPPKKTWTP